MSDSDQLEPMSAVTDESAAALGCGWWVLAAPVALGLALAGLVVAADTGLTPTQVTGAVLVAVWSAAGAALGVRRRHDRLGPVVIGGAVLGGAVVLAQAVAVTSSTTTAQVFARVGAAVLAAVMFHLLMSLPDGRLCTTSRRRVVVAGFLLALGAGAVASADLDEPPMAVLTIVWAAAIAAGSAAAYGRYTTAGAVARRRMQWLGWGFTVTAEAVLVVGALRLLADWPDSPGAVSLALTVVVPLSLIASTAARLVARVDRLLTHTVAIAGLTLLVLAIYIVVVLGLGRSPSGGERTLLLLSMLATAITALLYLPARRWLTERANRLVYGERVDPDQTLRTFGQRLTRSIPLDELLLQLAENLHKSMVLSSAEVWTGKDGRYERAAGVPHRHAAPITIGPKELPVVARAGVSGGTWLEIWVPQLVGSSGSAAMRVAPVAHAGMLLGFIAVTRRHDGEPFTETEDLVLTELARQIGLALHNVQLDAALQASLDELRVSNQELQDSRARIVTAADAERRTLERNLHDGAQQHLVALAVKLRLAQDAVDDDPAEAMAMIEEIKGDVRTAIGELRALAHGIFPPLLVSGGLNEALPSAAARAAVPTTVALDGVGRYPAAIEAAVYFCTLEALQNAGKHAGEGACATVTVAEVGNELRFEIRDDGVGFDLADDGATAGHGFVNMTDRLGAFGGHLEVDSSRGSGTTITGTVPLRATPTE